MGIALQVALGSDPLGVQPSRKQPRPRSCPLKSRVADLEIKTEK